MYKIEDCFNKRSSIGHFKQNFKKTKLNTIIMEYNLSKDLSKYINPVMDLTILNLKLILCA